MQLKDATILIVDDEADLRDIQAGWFKREGSRVLVAENGAEALALIRGGKVDVVVSDVRMPIMDGIALLKNVKATESYKSSVMFISGFTDIQPRDAYDLGVEAVMSKPVERKELMAVVTRVLAERDELWCLPPSDKAEGVLDAIFDSLASALSQGLLAFGRGGFCIQSKLKLQEGPVDLRLSFEADKRNVKGRGMIRWTAAPEPEVGVEIMYVDDDNRTWILSMTSPNELHAFIPRTAGVATTPLIKAEVET
jgi:two-component system chemotaxis response regulator CheY